VIENGLARGALKGVSVSGSLLLCCSQSVNHLRRSLLSPLHPEGHAHQ
jgi:hypothetical protein